MNSPLTWETEHGTVRLLPERGRILGISVAGHEALWAPPSAGAGWNLGGERLWIGPESDWFWKRTETVDFANYQVPPPLDPDLWTVTGADEESCHAEAELSLVCRHKETRISLRIQRSFHLIPSEGWREFGKCLAIRAVTRVAILGGTPGQPVDLWSILQVPSGGNMLVPVRGTPVPRDYFDPCPPQEMGFTQGLFRLHIGGPAMFKVGFQPEQTDGRIAYERRLDGGWLVILRTFPVHPMLRYCDVPLNAAAPQGDAAQFFNDGGKFGDFGEMEHRSPAIRCGIGPQEYQESTVTHAAFLSESEHQNWKSLFSAPL